MTTSNSAVNELRRLNDHEFKTIRDALEDLMETSHPQAWVARAMLEDDAEFVRGLFWTSKAGAAR